MVELAAKHAKQLFAQQYGAEFRRVAGTVPKFAAELAGQLAQGVEGDGSAPETPRTISVRTCPSRDCDRVVDMDTVRWTPDRRGFCPHCGRDYFNSEWEFERYWERW